MYVKIEILKYHKHTKIMRHYLDKMKTIIIAKPFPFNSIKKRNTQLVR